MDSRDFVQMHKDWRLREGLEEASSSQHHIGSFEKFTKVRKRQPVVLARRDFIGPKKDKALVCSAISVSYLLLKVGNRGGLFPHIFYIN